MANRIKSLLLALSIMLSAAVPGLAADNYGAIAYSPTTGAWGYWYNASSQSQANAKALAQCRKNGSGCKIAVHFRNACGAVYAGSNGWGAEWGKNRSQAEAKAAARCSRNTSGCTRVAWSCTSR